MALMLTKKGLALLQKLQVDEIESINFTNIAVGDGVWTSSEINQDINALKSEKLKTTIGAKQTEERNGNTIVTIYATLNNENVTESFYVREVGLYAMDNEIEILYAFDITSETEIAQGVIQSNIVPQRIPVILDTALSNINQVNITVKDSFMFVIQEQFDSYKQEVQAKFDTKQDKGDYIIKTTFDAELEKKADKTHNHDMVYSEINHTHSNYAASNHNHDGVYCKTNHTHSNYMAQKPYYIEFQTNNNSNHGGYIDFHWNSSTADYTSRIIESANGKLDLVAPNGVYINGQTVHATNVIKTVYGVWLEYPLSNGETALVGYIFLNTSSSRTLIPLPKRVKKLFDWGSYPLYGTLVAYDRNYIFDYISTFRVENDNEIAVNIKPPTGGNKSETYIFFFGILA